jgi:hypothetical protein
MSVLDSVLSVLSGGATGLIGTALQSVYQYKTRKLDIELEKSKAANELEQRKLDIEMQKQEWASRTQIAEITTAGEVDKADAETLAASYQLEPQQYSEKSLLSHGQEWVMVLLDAIRAIIRPGLTIYLCVLTSLIYFQTRGLIQTNQGDSFALLEKLVNTILYLFTTIVCWYFGTRNKNSK